MASFLAIGLTNAALAAVLAIVAFALTRISKNPHVAHAVWLVVLLKFLTPPLIDVPLPRGLFSMASETTSPTPVAADLAEQAPILPITPGLDASQDPAASTTSSPAPADLAPIPMPRVSTTPTNPAPAQNATPWPIYLGASWLAGSLLCAAIACIRAVRFHRQLKSTRPADDSIQHIGVAVARQLGLKRCPHLRIADGHLSPMVWPIGSPPTVVLPQGLVDELDREERRAIIAHEFAHIARRDCWVRWLEVLCTVLYWWHPCLWLARSQLRVAEEFCTDALAVASRPGSARVFGESLLKANEFLAGAPFAAPLLVSEMRSGGQLRIRIESIVKGSVAPRLPRVTKYVAVVIALAVLPLSAQERETSPSPGAGEQPGSAKGLEPRAPTIADIIAGLKAHEGALANLAVRCDIEGRHNFTKPGSGPLPGGLIQDDAVAMTRDGEVAWEVTSDGRGRMEAKYTTTSIRDDGNTKPRIHEHVSTFDGTAGQMLYIMKSPTGVITQRHQTPSEYFTKTESSPYDFTTQHLGKPISTLLSVDGSRVIGAEVWEERPVVVVEAPPVTVRDNYIYQQRFWIDPNRDYTVVRRQSDVQCGEGKPWGLHYQIDATQHKEVAPGFWLPTAIEILNYHVNETGQDFLSSREQIAASDWSVNQPIDPARFVMEPEGVSRIGAPIPTAAAPSNDSGQPSSSTGAPPEAGATPGFRAMLVKTVDDQGRPVAGVGIYVNIWPEGAYADSKVNYTTDASGQAPVLVPAPPRLVRIWTQKSGYVPLFAQWWPEQQADGKLIPKEFTFTLPTGTEIGGIIKNEDGEPIEGAVVEVSLGNQVEEMNRRPVPSMWLAETPGPGSNPCITDADGRWSLDNVPAGDDIFVRLKLTHPDYISDTQWGALQEEQSVPMSAFRDKSAALTMHRGIVLTGKVTDPEGKPAPNSLVVWGDDPYTEGGSQEVLTNAAGEYRLRPLNPGPTTVTIVAQGFSPASRSVTIQESAATQNFQLEKGNLLRIRFVDSGGKPVPKVGVAIRGWRGAQSLYNHRHPNVLNTNIPVRSDEQGVFEWSWAPADAVAYAFYATGLKSIEQSLKADGSEHTVTLSK